MNKYVEKIERFTLRLLNRMVYGGECAPKGIELMSGEELNQFIYEGLMSKESFMVARFGSYEINAALYPHLCNLPLKERYKLYLQKRIDFLRYTSEYAQYLMNPFCNNAGFFPNDISLLKKYNERLLLEDAGCCDCLCCSEWIREDLAKPFLSAKVQYASIANMEPYDYAQPWSRALAGKKVLVVHPFAKTIEAQYQKREDLWGNKDVLPEFQLHTIKAVQSIAGEEVPFDTWFDAFHYMEQQMDAIDYDVAIIGCGAYGFSLAAHAKRMGKKAVHLGGATQILFGIRGRRWDDILEMQKFYNEYWIYPSSEETPHHKERVEEGCYW